MSTICLYVLSWFGMAVVAVLNGALREKTYGARIKELTAHQISTLTGVSLLGGYIWLLSIFRPIASPTEALSIGGIWFGMTIAFEFLFGHYVMKHPWKRLFYDYNIFEGRVWVFVLVWTAVSPYIFFLLQN